jgi:hypothetical protein
MREEAKARGVNDFSVPERTKIIAAFTADDMRGAFTSGAAFARAHQFMPPEMNPVKAAEEALANWPD